MEPEDAFNKLQQQELLLKFVEIGKVLLTWAILKNVDMVSVFIQLQKQEVRVNFQSVSLFFVCMLNTRYIHQFLTDFND